MEQEVEQSNVEEIQTDSTPVENETSTQETDAVETEVVEENVPLSRLNKEVYKKHEAKREADSLRKQNDELQAKLASQQAPQSKRPSLEDEDIDYDENAYQEKLLDWKLDQRDAKRQKEQATRKETQSNNDLLNAFDKKVNEYSIENPDYIKDLENSSNIVYDSDVQSILLQSENGARLDHYLLKNLSELDNMANMNTYQKMQHLAKIESNFSKPKTIKKSNASEPIETVKGGAKPPTDNLRNINGATFD